MSGGIAPLGERSDALLSARDLGRKYEDFLALGSFHLDLAAGEFVALIGPNGAGKTTFLTLAAGLLAPTTGSVAVQGFPAGSIEARAALSYLPDAPVFYEDLSLEEHLGYVAALHGVDDPLPRIEELLRRLEMDGWGDALPSEFSKGMRQKASIALALVRPFSVLLADEPFDGLDPRGREVLFELLAEARGGGAALIVSTHRPDVIAASSRCVVVRDGRLVYDGEPSATQVEAFFAEERLPNEERSGD